MRFTITQIDGSCSRCQRVRFPFCKLYNWYNHEIANFELNNNYSVRFWTEYESWRGPRRQLSGGVYQNGNLKMDLSILGKSYARSGPPPVAYYADSKNLVYIRYPGPSRNYVVGDLKTGEFTTGFSIDRSYPELRDLLTEPERLKWQSVLTQIQESNPDATLRWNDSIGDAG